jgi:hypothetical protein
MGKALHHTNTTSQPDAICVRAVGRPSSPEWKEALKLRPLVFLLTRAGDRLTADERRLPFVCPAVCPCVVDRLAVSSRRKQPPRADVAADQFGTPCDDFGSTLATAPPPPGIDRHVPLTSPHAARRHLYLRRRAIWIAGVKLSNTTDVLSQRFGFGQALGGVILLALATWSGDLGVAVGNILGGIAIQTVVLVAVC